MTSITRDPLLAIAKGLLWFLMACTLIGAAACVAAVPLMHVFQNDITIELSKEAPHLVVSQFMWIITGLLACAVVLLLLVFRIFQLLKRIVDTVALGDPFVPINADRLTQMAWLSLGVQIASFVIGSIAQWLDHVAGDAPHIRGEIQVDGGLSGNGLLLMLILFILARVFRQGAAMRAELEGTV
ncbi:DUF2975 domain-containing protein [Novosphingobium sp. 9U]|uniref:DUF2975 domain-containing protein n=1 Tax=Novosphingobium sp. 9U TaxID=2653158 RepID=UPI0012F0D9BC|nr:DUF2975 domain-containing protein [Novosphingobium sp. 9U]VWX53404.1 conserved membrane hypothetical protein [Novosphingobium sp. 9U]